MNIKKAFVSGITVAGLLATLAFPALADSSNSAVVINDLTCGLYDGNGGFVITDESHTVVTNNGNGTLTCKATGVTPSSTQNGAVHWNFENKGVPCGTSAGFTTDWQETVSPSGQATLVCHVH